MIREAIGAYDDMIPELSSVVLDEHKSLVPTRYDLKEVETLVFDYLDWSSERLAQRGVLTSTEIYSKLDQLGL